MTEQFEHTVTRFQGLRERIEKNYINNSSNNNNNNILSKDKYWLYYLTRETKAYNFLPVRIEEFDSSDEEWGKKGEREKRKRNRESWISQYSYDRSWWCE